MPTQINWKCQRQAPFHSPNDVLKMKVLIAENSYLNVKKSFAISWHFVLIRLLNEPHFALGVEWLSSNVFQHSQYLFEKGINPSMKKCADVFGSAQSMLMIISVEWLGIRSPSMDTIYPIIWKFNRKSRRILFVHFVHIFLSWDILSIYFVPSRHVTFITFKLESARFDPLPWANLS